MLTENRAPAVAAVEDLLRKVKEKELRWPSEAQEFAVFGDRLVELVRPGAPRRPIRAASLTMGPETTREPVDHAHQRSRGRHPTATLGSRGRASARPTL